jgi:hypothetical protein
VVSFGLFGKQLRAIGECLELQHIAAGIEQKHGCLFTGLTLKAYVQFDYEARAGCLQAVGQCIPLVH